MEVLKKKYGLFTAICMVVGIVIGSGVFFKAQNVLAATEGNALLGILAWIIGGLIMVVVASTFAIMATKYERVNGLVDYAEFLCGKTYAYYVGWFLSTIYFPAMTSVLAWVSARYTLVAILGNDSGIFSAECITIALLYLVLSYAMNSIAPKIAGKFQVSTTVIKLVPLAFIAIVGTIIGLVNGNLVNNFNPEFTAQLTGGEGNLFAAICCTAFAYEGWIIATAINAEIKDAKKNLPLALCIGTLIIVAVYVLYYIGVLGLAGMDELLANGTYVAFGAFGSVGATIINVLVIISCLGTLNGLMLACTRSYYSLAARNEGVKPETFVQIDKETNMPHNSAILALATCAVWFAYFVGGQAFGWFGDYAFDSSELPNITIYPLYIPILILFMKREKDLHPVKRFVLPILSLVGVVVMVIASIASHGIKNLYYLVVFAVIMALGALFMRYNNRKLKKNS